MKKLPFLAVILAVFSALAPQVEAGTISRKDFRKFTGFYYGSLFGTYGEADDSGDFEFEPYGFDAEIRISNRRVDRVLSPTGRFHTLSYAEPRGNSRRVKIRGVFVGTFFNPITGYDEPVLGGRNITIKDKGRGKRFQYLMSVAENIEEYRLSYLDVSGRLGKN